MQIVFACLLLAASVTASPLNQRTEIVEEKNINITISLFEKVMNLRKTTPDPVHSTPAVVFVGTKNKVLRCLYEDPKECEVFYEAGRYVTSLLVVGEYIYVGLNSGKILKCDLDRKESCTNFATAASGDVRLANADGYLYAGFYSKSILRCKLNEPNSCQSLHELESNVLSLLHSNKYIYVGLNNGQLFRCSLSTENSCTLLYTMNSAIMGLSNVGNYIYAVTHTDSRLWKCTQKSDATIDSCEYVALNYTKSSHLASFKGDLYTVEWDIGIYLCKWANTTECSIFGNFTDAYSLAFVYGTYHMQSRFKMEGTTCSWQNNSKCPPFITYYDARQRAALEVRVKDDKLHNSQGLLVDTADADVGQMGKAAIFVMSPDGTILLSNSHKTELLHTSSLLAGHPVSGAGEIIVNNGVIEKITTCSAHYWPDLNLNRQVVESLRSQGYTGHIELEVCSEDVDLGQYDANIDQ